MSKNFSQFVQEAYIKTINEEELAELLNDLAEEHDLTEEETQQVLDELFGSVVKKLGSFLSRKKTSGSTPSTSSSSSSSKPSADSMRNSLASAAARGSMKSSGESKTSTDKPSADSIRNSLASAAARGSMKSSGESKTSTDKPSADSIRNSLASAAARGSMKSSGAAPKPSSSGGSLSSSSAAPKTPDRMIGGIQAWKKKNSARAASGVGMMGAMANRAKEQDQSPEAKENRKKKAGGGVTASGSAYVTHPTTGRKISVSGENAARIGRGEMTIDDIVNKPKRSR